MRLLETPRVPTWAVRGAPLCLPAPHSSRASPTKVHVYTSYPQVAFCNSALASAKQKQARLRGQLKEQRLRCQHLARLAAPGTAGNSVPGETHQALQVAMDKLQVCGCSGLARGVVARAGCRALISALHPAPDPLALTLRPDRRRCRCRAASWSSCRRRWI